MVRESERQLGGEEERELKRLESWWKTKGIALTRSNPNLNRPQRSLTNQERTERSRDNARLRKLVKTLRDPDPNPIDAEMARVILEEIRARHQERVIEPADLYDIFGISPTTPAPPASAISTGNKGMSTIKFEYKSPLPQPDPDSKTAPINVDLFMENWRTQTPEEFIGGRITTPVPEKINNNPRKDRGSVI